MNKIMTSNILVTSRLEKNKRQPRPDKGRDKGDQGRPDKGREGSYSRFTWKSVQIQLGYSGLQSRVIFYP